MGATNSHQGNGGGGNKEILRRQSHPADEKLSGSQGFHKFGMTRTVSGADIQDRSISQFIPVEKLATILHKKSQEEFGINGIAADTFVNSVFPQYPNLGHRFFHHLHTSSKAQTRYLGITAFRQQCERFLGILDDAIIVSVYVYMFADADEVMRPEGLRALLMACYTLAMAHYKPNTKTVCNQIERTLATVIASCFISKDTLSPGFVARWLETNTPGLIPPLHRFCVHTLSTAYRSIADKTATFSPNLSFELTTPILEQTGPFVKNGSDTVVVDEDNSVPLLLPVSQAWLLAGALPAFYSKPQTIQAPNQSGLNLASTAFLAKMLSAVPSHWTLLYDTRHHGVGANRFLHHVLGYKGPTLILLRASEDHIFCIAAPDEWRETHLYTGGPDCCVIQLHPKFALIEKGEKMLYLNTSIRGYPKGLRAGKDPRKPLISVDEHFEKIEYRSVPFTLLSIEVWGCGDKRSRDVQIDIKKWQVKEAERQRQVKLTAADWMDHPDRYLLELGGRPQYNNSAS